MFDLSQIGAEFTNWSTQMVNAWGYLGVFIVTLAGNATIILPLPSYLAVFALGPALNPWILGVVAALGATLGELTGYAVGFGGNKVMEAKDKKLTSRTQKWTETHGIFPVIVLFAATPLPDDVAGIIGGAAKYDIKRFLLATFIGKTISHLALAWGGFFGGYALGGYGGLFSVLIFIIFTAAVFKFIFEEKSKS